MVKYYTNNYSHNINIVNGKIINEEEEKLFFNNVDNNNNYYTKSVNNNIIDHQKITENNLREYLDNFNNYLLDKNLFITPEIYLEARKKMSIDNEPFNKNKKNENFFGQINDYSNSENDSDIDTIEIIKSGEKILGDLNVHNFDGNNKPFHKSKENENFFGAINEPKNNKKVFGAINNDSDSDNDTMEIIKSGEKILGDLNDHNNDSNNIEIIKSGEKLLGDLSDNNKYNIFDRNQIGGDNKNDISNVDKSSIDNEIYVGIENKNIKFNKNNLFDIKIDRNKKECERIENKYKLKNLEKKNERYIFGKNK